MWNRIRKLMNLKPGVAAATAAALLTFAACKEEEKPCSGVEPGGIYRVTVQSLEPDPDRHPRYASVEASAAELGLSPGTTFELEVEYTEGRTGNPKVPSLNGWAAEVEPKDPGAGCIGGLMTIAKGDCIGSVVLMIGSGAIPCNSDTDDRCFLEILGAVACDEASYAGFRANVRIDRVDR